MAQIGLRHFKYSPIKDGKYTGANKMSGAIKSTPSLNVAEAELRADDTVVESIHEVTKGTLALTVADDDDTIFAPLLGHTTTEEGEVLKSRDDIPPYVGFGRVIVKMVNGKRKYKAEFFTKVKFKPYATEGETQGENVDFKTPNIEGTIYVANTMINGKELPLYERHQTFDTDEEAQAYLDNLMKAPEEAGN